MFEQWLFDRGCLREGEATLDPTINVFQAHSNLSIVKAKPLPPVNVKQMLN